MKDTNTQVHCCYYSCTQIPNMNQPKCDIAVFNKYKPTTIHPMLFPQRGTLVISVIIIAYACSLDQRNTLKNKNQQKMSQ